MNKPAIPIAIKIYITVAITGRCRNKPLDPPSAPEATINMATITGDRVLTYNAIANTIKGNRKNTSPLPNICSKRSVYGLKLLFHRLSFVAFNGNVIFYPLPDSIPMIAPIQRKNMITVPIIIKPSKPLSRLLLVTVARVLP